MAQLRSREYFERRAEEERQAAATAADHRAAKSHHELSVRYAELAAGTAEVPDDGAEQRDNSILNHGFRIIP